VIKFEKEKEKIKVRIKIEVEEIKFSEYKDFLRVNGRILEASDEVVGHYHTFDIKKGSEFILTKKNGFKKYEIKILEESEKEDKNIMVISVDSNEISAGIISNEIKILKTEEINIKKDDINYESKLYNIYSDFVNLIKEYKPKILCIVGPAFYPDKFKEYCENKVDVDKILTFKVSLGGENGIYEFSRRTEYLDVLKDLEILELNKKINEILYLMDKGYILFGFNEVYKNALYGNVEYVLISEDYFRKIKESEEFNNIVELLNVLDDIDAKIYFVYRDVQNYELIDKFGIVGKARYKI
ncbi:MAG: hypothetical protein ACPLX8_01020, partial [Nanopusillaceae archaeon]